MLEPSRSSSSAAEKPSSAMEEAAYKPGQCTVTCIHQAKIGGVCRNVTVAWCKNLINHSVTVTVENPAEQPQPHSCKIDLKPWPFWSKKGCKTLDVDGKPLDMHWDFRSAKFSSGSEPMSDYYLALVYEEEVVLLLGDWKKEAYKRTKARPSLVDATMVSKREYVFGKKCFSTRAKFDERRKEHDIVVENSISGPSEPEMWISVDGLVLIHVTNLQWKFRGNETVLVNKLPVQVFWDVHDWLFSAPGSGHALFIFKPGAPEFVTDEDGSGAGVGGGDCDSRYYSVESHAQVPEFCLFLYAWKVE